MSKPISPDTIRAIADVILFFKTAFSVVMALAITEAFKQSIADKTRDGSIHWDTVPSLVAFLALSFPFFQGMSRYFFAAYGNIEAARQPYAVHLMIDSVNFMVEAAIFFVMSRCLAAAQWHRFYGCVLVMALVDLAWTFIGGDPHDQDFRIWVSLDIGLALAVIILLLVFRRTQHPLHASLAGMAAIVVRSTIDYVLLWNSYFPPLDAPGS